MTSEIGTLISTIATAIASMASVVAVFVAFKAAKYASHQANLLRDQVLLGNFLLSLKSTLVFRARCALFSACSLPKSINLIGYPQIVSGEELAFTGT